MLISKEDAWENQGAVCRECGEVSIYLEDPERLKGIET